MPDLFGFWAAVDRALVVQRNTFGEPAVVFFAGAPPDGLTVVGVFDCPDATADLGLHRDLSDQAPWIGFRVLDLPGAALPLQGDRVQVRGVDWEVTDVQSRGDTHVRCRLFRAGYWAPTPLPPLEPIEPVEPDEPPMSPAV